MTQIGQGVLDAPVAPRRILLRHTHHKLFDLLRHTRAAELAARLTAVKLLSDQALVPPQEGLGGHKRRRLFQTLAAERVGQRGEAAALGVGETEPSATELRFEDTVFREEIDDDLLLVPLQPAGHYGNEHVQDHRWFSAWRQRSHESM
jgi:hypothetical protein